MPQVNNPNSVAASIGGQLKDKQRQLDDIKGASRNSVYSLVVGLGGAIFNGVAQFLAAIVGPFNVTGAVGATTTVTAGTSLNAGTDVNATAGNVNTVNVNATGQVTSAQPVRSIGSYNYSAGTNRRTMWIDDTGQMGQTVSSVRYKHDFAPMTDEQVASVLSLRPVWGRYNWSPEDSPREAFLIAEDVAALDLFGQDVLVRNDEGKPDGLNYSQFVAPLLAICRRQQTQIHELSVRLAEIDHGEIIAAPTDLPSAAGQPVSDPVLDPNPPMA